MDLSDVNWGAVIGILAAVGLVAFIIVLALYLVDAIARFKYLKVRNYDNAWMAFIPIANIYSTVEATYGNEEKINIYGLWLPSILIKLYPLVLGVAATILVNIPLIGGIIGTLVYVAQIALGVMILRDMMERLRKDIAVGLAIVACIIPIVASIIILSSCSDMSDGQYDYMNDSRILNSQADMNGPLSGFGKKFH